MSKTKRGCIVVEQSFANGEYFYDTLKEFEIIKNFDLEHIKTDSSRFIARCPLRSTLGVYMPLLK